jgi:dienelactone hydrolase
MRARAQCLFAASIAAILPVTVLSAQGGPSDKPAPSSRVSAVAATGQPVLIKHGSTTLNGIIETPAGTEQYAGIVIVYPGDDKASEVAQQIAKAFAKQGIIALTYRAIEPNSAEAISAIQNLKLRGDLKRDEVGIIGIGSAAKMAADVAKAENLRYAIAVAPTAEKSVDPAKFGKLSKKILVVRGVEDPFSTKTDRFRQSVERKARNVTLWTLPDSDIETLGNPDSPLLGRIIRWAADRG